MAPLNPFAPLYFPAFVQRVVGYYYLPPPPPPPVPHAGLPLPPVQLCYNSNPCETTVVWSSTYPTSGANDLFNGGYYAPSPSGLQACSKTALELGCVECMQCPRPFFTPLPLLEKDKPPLSLSAEEGKPQETPLLTSDVKAEDCKVRGTGTKFDRSYCRRRSNSRGFNNINNVFVGRTRRAKRHGTISKGLLTNADDFEIKYGGDQEATEEGRTTVMIKNIPNKLSKVQLIELLDSHCFQENRQIREANNSATSEAAISEYDFMYLPIDFRSNSNLGYAFVNFTSAAAARRLHRVYHKRGWDDLLGSRKVCEITYARIQGLVELLNHFKNSIFTCDKDEYLPVKFIPSRDGTRDSEQHYVGRRTAADRKSNDA